MASKFIRNSNPKFNNSVYKFGKAVGTRKASDNVIHNDLQYIYSMICIELSSRGMTTDEIADLLNATQQRWIEYANGDRTETPTEMCLRITGIDLLSE